MIRLGVNDVYNYILYFNVQQLYDNNPAQSEATLKIRVSGEAKKSFEVPINKADSRFFKFVFRGDETGEEQVSSDEILASKY